MTTPIFISPLQPKQSIAIKHNAVSYDDTSLSHTHPLQLIDMKYIVELTGMTDKWFYALIKQGKFPKPIKLGRSSRWILADIEQWILMQS